MRFEGSIFSNVTFGVRFHTAGHCLPPIDGTPTRN
jgi:hypothetical protein